MKIHYEEEKEELAWSKVNKQEWRAFGSIWMTVKIKYLGWDLENCWDLVIELVCFYLSSLRF